MAQATLTVPMQRFVDDVRAVVREGGGEEIVTQKVAALLRSLLNEGDVLDPRYTRPKTGNYVLYPIWVEPGGGFSIAAAVWDVAQVTPVHDHGTWGVIGIYRGVEHEVRFRPAVTGGGARFRQTDERDIETRQVIVCCTSDQDIHRVACGSNVPCVGIHVYGADIGAIRRHVYDVQTGDVRAFVSGWTAVDA
jgi:predicted metal-dependent enzyme (double-stranded beta helix superfamily)